MTDILTLAVSEYNNKRLPDLEGCYTCRAMGVKNGTRKVYEQNSMNEPSQYRVKCTGCGRTNVWNNDAFLVARRWNHVEHGYVEKM